MRCVLIGILLRDPSCLFRGFPQAPVLRVAYLFALSFENGDDVHWCKVTLVPHRADCVVPPDGAYGFRDANGTWNGVVGMVATDEVEFGLSLFSFVKERMDVIDYLPPILSQK